MASEAIDEIYTQVALAAEEAATSGAQEASAQVAAAVISASGRGLGGAIRRAEPVDALRSLVVMVQARVVLPFRLQPMLNPVLNDTAKA